MLLLASGAVTAYAAWNSLPGNSLFGLKRAEENAQLIFTINPQAKAKLAVVLAQKRLAEAQQVFSNPAQNNQQEQTAALAELSSQTSSALAAVSSVAQTNPQSANNHPLLSSLENLTQQQQSLLTQIKPDTQIKQAAQSALLALNNNSKQLSQIKETVAVATNDQALTQLSATSTAVAVLGAITQISSGQVTVEKTAFIVNSQTVVQDPDGNTLKLSDVTAGSKANVLGNQTPDGLVANQILITDPSDVAATSTDASPTPSITVAAPPATTSATTTVKKVPPATDTSTSEDMHTGILQIPTDPNMATGGFIVEDPNPVFH